MDVKKYYLVFSTIQNFPPPNDNRMNRLLFKHKNQKGISVNTTQANALFNTPHTLNTKNPNPTSLILPLFFPLAEASELPAS